MPAIGDNVFIKPAPQHCGKGELSRVLADGETGRFLPVEGEAVVWSQHHAQRFRHGEIAIFPTESGPGPVDVTIIAPASAAPVKE